MNKSDILEIIEGAALILGGAVIINAIMNLGKKEDTSEKIKDYHSKAIKNANERAIGYSQTNSSNEYSLSH